MKYIKLLIITCLPLFFVACDDDDAEKLNSGNVVVEFLESTIEIKEGVDFLQIPITITGETNGLIKVKATLKESNADFKLDTNVLFTNETTRVPMGTENAYIEIRLNVVDNEINHGRYLVLEISGVEGAKVGSNSTFRVDLIENNPLEGTYDMTGESVYDGVVKITNCKVVADESDPNLLLLDLGYGGCANMRIVEEIIPVEEYNIAIDPLHQIGSASGYAIFITWANRAGQYDPTAPLTGKFKNGVITLDTGLGLLAVNPSTGAIAGWWDRFAEETISFAKR